METNDRIGDYKLTQKVTIDVHVDTDIDIDHMRQAIMDALTYADNVTREEDLLIGRILSEIQKQLNRD
jgi:hypothetical protein